VVYPILEFKEKKQVFVKVKGSNMDFFQRKRRKNTSGAGVEVGRPEFGPREKWSEKKDEKKCDGLS
jgi:hypothetical protein